MDGKEPDPKPKRPATDDDSPPDALQPKILPATGKIGEDRDNLRRREDWFQKRSSR